MKKRILIALAVALATGAQAQVDEWVNPLKDLCEKVKDYGVFDYVQKESDMELGKWYLTNSKNKDKYPTVVNYNNEMFVRINGDDSYHFAIILRKPDCLNKISIKYNAIHFNDNGEKTENSCVEASVTFFNKDFNNLDSSEVFKEAFSPFGLESGTIYFYEKGYNANGEFVSLACYKDYVRFRLELCSSNHKYNAGGYCLINNIEIKFEDYNSTISKKYFYEPYCIDIYNNLDITCFSEEYDKYLCEKYPDLPKLYPDKYGYLTTSTNDSEVESGIYVSNNVLYTGEPSSVCIYNTCGVIVKKEYNVTTLDLSDLKKGVYIAKVNGAPIRFVR